MFRGVFRSVFWVFRGVFWVFRGVFWVFKCLGVVRVVRYTSIQIEKKKLIQEHFHPKTVSYKNTFVQKPFHPKQKTISSTTLSSKNGFIQ